MNLEFNKDEQNHMLIGILSGEYVFEKVVKVIGMTLERCDEQQLNRALLDMAQLQNIDINAIENYIFSKDLAATWGNKVKLCIVYDHKFLAEISDEAKQGPGGWVLVTANKNQSVFWLLAS